MAKCWPPLPFPRLSHAKTLGYIYNRRHMRGVVTGLFIAPGKKEKPISVEAVSTNERGFAGDYHSAFANNRQILIISQSILHQFDLQPGAISENVVVDGIDVMALSEGQHLRMGTAVLEITFPCESCVHMERIRVGLKSALRNHRGMFARVVTPGATNR